MEVPIQLQQMILYTLVSSAVGHLCQCKSSMNVLHWVKFIDAYSLGHWGRADVVTIDVQIPSGPKTKTTGYPCNLILTGTTIKELISHRLTIDHLLHEYMLRMYTICEL